jgi:hypothetical protein
MLPKFYLTWSPVTGSANYAKAGATVTPHNPLTTAGATPHVISGTPGTGQTRLGK